MYISLRNKKFKKVLSPFAAKTSLLLKGTTVNGGANGTFVDSGPNNVVLTKVGNPTQGTLSPQGLGTSAYFDGVGDYLTTPATSRWSGPYTFETWVYPMSASDYAIFGSYTDGQSYTWKLMVSTTNSYGLAVSMTSVNGTVYWFKYSGVFPPLNTWSHIVVSTGASGLINIFLNGVSLGLTIVSNTAWKEPMTIITVFQYPYKIGTFKGCLASTRLVIGTELYTSNFTPSPYISGAANTAFLLKYNGANVVDVANKNDLVTIGTARVDTTTKKYTSGSIYFNGTTDKLTVPMSSDFAFGTGDFTIEAWVYQIARSSQQVIIGAANTGGAFDWFLSITSSGYLIFQINPSASQTSTLATVPLNTWTHVAVSRYNGTLSFFINGITYTTFTYATSAVNTMNVTIGGSLNSNAAAWFSGYMADLRVSKEAIYKSSFTLPTAPYPVKSVPVVDDGLSDTNFNQVSLLLKNNQVPVTISNTDNNTYLDSSGVLNTITKVGNPSQGAVSPINSGWATNFTSGNDALWLNYANSSALWAGSLFTIEAWLNPASDNWTLLDWCPDIYSGGWNNWQWWFGHTTAHGLRLHIDNYGAQSWYVYTTVKVPVNQWSHIVLQKNGNSWLFSINGIVQGQSSCNSSEQGGWASSFSLQTTNADSVPSSCIGYGRGGSSPKGSLQVHSLRVTKSALYTSNFTPIVNLEVISNTVLLICKNGNTDYSPSNYIFTQTNPLKLVSAPSGSVKSTPSVLSSGSVYFNNNNSDYLTVPVSSRFAYGSGDFTLEAWIYPTAFQAAGTAIWSQTVAGTNYFLFWISATGVVQFTGIASGVGTPITAGTAMLNTWNHVAVARVSGVITVYLNGVSGTSVANAVNFTNVTYVPTVGRYSHAAGLPFNGYISGLHVINGTAKYTSNFTLPTTAITPVANTVFLLNCATSGIIDSSAKSNVSTFGALPNYSVVPTGINNSIKFNGTSDYLTIPPSSRTVLPGDYTVEAWIYSTAASGNIVSLSTNLVLDYWGLQLLNNQIVFSAYGSNRITSGNISLNTWYHIALSRVSGTNTIYINGVPVVTTFSNGASIGDLLNPITIGNSCGTGVAKFSGYMSNLRITNGVARYTTTFTPSAQSFPSNLDTDPYFNNVSLLLKGDVQSNDYYSRQNNLIADSSNNHLLVTRYGNTTLGTTTPFSPSNYNVSGWSAYSNGSSGRLYSPLDMSGVPLTIEMWVKYAVNPGQYNGAILVSEHTNGDAGEQYFSIMSDYTLSYGVNNALGPYGLSTTEKLVPNVWTHVAMCLSSTSSKIFINGKLCATGAAKLWVNTGENFNFGWGAYGASYFKGSMNSIRITRGLALYSSSFTPSVILPALPETVFLLSVTATEFKDISVSNNIGVVTGMTTVYEPVKSVVPYSPSNHGGSIYLDGIGDYVKSATSSYFNMATGNWTMEAWCKPTLSSALQTVITAGLLKADGHGITQSSGDSWAYQVNGTLLITGGTLYLNSWYHLAAVRNNGSTTLYVNGVSVGTTTTAPSNKDYPIVVGAKGDPVEYFNGYVMDARVVSSAVYTANFSNPTAPLTAITGTQFLLNGGNESIYDASSNIPVETVGTVLLSNAQTKFSSYSAYFDGTVGSYLKLPAGSLKLELSDFTIDFWYYRTGNVTSGVLFSTSAISGYTGLVIYDNNSNLTLNGGSTGVNWDMFGAVTVTAMAANTWHHISLRRVGSLFSMYFNGVMIYKVLSAASIFYNAANTPSIGGLITGNTIQGYIEDFRITIGKGRYSVDLGTTELIL